MKFDQMEIPFGSNQDKKNEVEGGAIDSEYRELSYKEEQIVRNLLGVPDKIYKKVKEALDALDRKQAGSFRVGTPAFVNALIESGRRRIEKEEFNLCRDVINFYIDEIREEQALHEEVGEELDKWRNEKVKIGALELEKSETERAGVSPEDL